MCKHLGFSKCAERRLSQGVQDVEVACSYYIFLCRILRTWEPQELVDTLGRSAVLGDMSDRWSMFQHNHKQGVGIVRYTIVSGEERYP